MEFNNDRISEIVRYQLSIDLNCKISDLLNDRTIFCESGLNNGRRMFERQKPFIEAATMGNGIVVSADTDIVVEIEALLRDKLRDDLFFAPIFYGHSIYFIPDCETITNLTSPKQFSFHIKEGRQIYDLYSIPGFNNAIQYDRDHARPDVLVIYAMKDDKIAGMAGASQDSKLMWQIGVDVLPEYRNTGIASYLVNRLAIMIMEHGAVPYYGTASSNIPSQMTAHRSFLKPAWMCTYKNILDGKSPYSRIVNNFLSKKKGE